MIHHWLGTLLLQTGMAPEPRHVEYRSKARDRRLHNVVLSRCGASEFVRWDLLTVREYLKILRRYGGHDGDYQEIAT